MNRPTRAVLAFLVTSLATVNLTALVAHGYRPAPDLDPVRLDRAISTARPVTYPVERVDVAVPVPGELRSGWLFRPVGAGTGPALVLVGGAGPHRRDDLVGEAETLARAGVTTVVIDKRVDGYGLLHRDFDALAADAAASARWLARQVGVDPHRVGLIGWSEGGWIVPLAAAREPDAIAYVVLVSAPIVSPLEQVGHVTEDHARRAPRWLHRVIVTTLAGGPMLSSYVAVDVRPELARLSQPVYAVWGAQDTVVPVTEAVTRLRTAVPAATIRVRPGLGHSWGATDQRWTDDVVAWLDAPPDAAATSTGVAPTSRVGVPTSPPTRWFLHPAPHLALALTVAALGAALPRRRHDLRRPS